MFDINRITLFPIFEKRAYVRPITTLLCGAALINLSPYSHSLPIAGSTATTKPSAQSRAQASTKSETKGRSAPVLPTQALAQREFGNDAPWFEANIPFFECSDPQIQQIYYYRWKLYKSHLKDLGDMGYITTEFLNDVSWSLKPYESLNDATGFHLHEGRWLHDSRFNNDYLTFLYEYGGNDRHFSEAIADAAYDCYLVNGDKTTVLTHLEAMKRIYRQWDDHFDRTRGLYFIEPLLDATEYTISSIDASGGKDGFFGGHAFRPTINAFMFANANAISKIAQMTGDSQTAKEYAEKATTLRALTQTYLWNDTFEHFVDRYQVNNPFVTNWSFIRGRELAGYSPWYFHLPDNSPKYVASWQYLLSPEQLGGKYGLRTVEPSYEYYKKQYRFVRENGQNKPECQWNGPSWPFQTTLTLGGMANLLNDYPKQNRVTAADYLRLLRQYTLQHYVNGQPDLQEDYDPDTGQVIVGLERSHHYNHSGYIDLIITGLAGLRPRADDILEVHPLVPTSGPNDSLAYFCLENVQYHGRLVTILYDRDGNRYHRGKGLSVYVDGRQVVKPSPLGKKTVALPPTPPSGTASPPPSSSPVNLAVNVTKNGFPAPSASGNTDKGSLYQAVDGRVWFYPTVRNYWTNAGAAPQPSDWFSVDFGRLETVDTVKLSFFGDVQSKFKAPQQVKVQYWTGSDWADVSNALTRPAAPLANGENTVTFASVQTSQLRAVFTNPESAAVALVEFKAFGSKAYPATDLFQPGDTVSEAAHRFTGTNTFTGTFRNRLWRDARNGGSFSFDLPVTPGANYDLAVQYWGEETGSKRSFTVLVEDQKVGEQTLDKNYPGRFFDVTYPIPASLTQNKTRVRVTFQAQPDATAGGLYLARLIRR